LVEQEEQVLQIVFQVVQYFMLEVEEEEVVDSLMEQEEQEVVEEQVHLPVQQEQ
jgi:hypothetical protein